ARGPSIRTRLPVRRPVVGPVPEIAGAARRVPEQPPVSALAPRAGETGVLIGLCVATVAFCLLQILTFGYGRDQGIYAMVARAILAGKMPYRDAWDFKPPGIFVIYAIGRALFGSTQSGIRVLEVGGLLAMTAGMIRLATAWWGDRRIGYVAAALVV